MAFPKITFGGAKTTTNTKASSGGNGSPTSPEYASGGMVPTEVTSMIHDVPSLKDIQDDFNKDVRDTSEQAVSDYDKLYQDVLKTPGTEIDERYGTNFAKEGRYGNLNNKSFDDTLRLSRQADAYNNKPIGKMHLGISYNPSSGQGVGGFETTGYERPNLETQEMRQMRTNERLDEMQRGLDVQLEHNITKLPYDAFVKTLDSKYNIRTSEADAKRAFAQIRAVDRATQTMAQHNTNFESVFKLKYGLLIGKIASEVAKTNTIQSTILCNAVLGFPAIPIQDLYTYKVLDPLVKDFTAKIEKEYAGDPLKQLQALNQMWSMCFDLGFSKDAVEDYKKQNQRYKGKY